MPNKPLVINIFGGPCSGKSTTALGLAYKLKLKHINAELLTEYAKSLTHEKRFSTLKNQSYVTTKQLHKQYILSDQYDAIITDTSILLGLIPMYQGFGNTPSFEAWILECYNLFDNVNVLLQRNDSYVYQTSGRNQDKKEAIVADEQIKTLLDRLKLDFVVIPVDGERTVSLIENEVHSKMVKRGYDF